MRDGIAKGNTHSDNSNKPDFAIFPVTMGAWEPFHFGLLGLNYNYLQSLLKLQILVCCDLFRNIFVPKGLSWLRFTLNGKKYSVLSYLVPPHRVSVFCYSTALPECWLIETENESIKIFQVLAEGMENYVIEVIPGENIPPRATRDTVSWSNHWVTERTSGPKVSVTAPPDPGSVS